ncbi:HAD family hydrolase [Pontibacter sp. 172403-2]|uniref:HAD family hydrolase n=1 Tax=Pontibacter rufus TaxID=2791028 RepID=UPI0018B01429|nr:HAD family hydrolase [Pontibacter sp. 172403-2]MBF9254101.1 HAD family hydrolase [Pontibacter sp. 172403-2]
MFENTDSLIFDLDGTLWNASAVVAKGVQTATKEAGYTHKITADDISSLAGLPHDEVYRKLFPDLSNEQRAELMEKCAKAEIDFLEAEGGQLYDKLEETLRYLHGKYKLFIVSNCQDGYIEIFLHYHQLQRYFDGHACYGAAGKPKADNIKAVVKDNGLQSAIYIGDTKGDYDASQKAGLPFIFARYGFGQVEADVASIDSFSDLQEIF